MVVHAPASRVNSSHDGKIGDPITTRLNQADWASLAATWDSDEYKADWGLGGINADYAYALGYTGEGVKVGVVDSGFDASHPELSQGNIHPVTTSGTYYADGYHFEDVTDYEDLDDPRGQHHTYYSPHYAEGQIIEEKGTSNISVAPDSGSAFRAGDAFDVPGAYNGSYNDPHGTHVTGTIGAARDGAGMHGVAFGADVYVANTDSTDGTIYGPNSDYNYFLAAYTADVGAGSRAINNSWGGPPHIDSYDTVDELTDAFKRFFGQKTYLDAAAEVATGKGVIQVWAAGNGHYANPDIRSSLPYFRPGVEKDWLVVGASEEKGFLDLPTPGTPANVDVGYLSQLAGVAKYWTVFAPGVGIDSSVPTYKPGDDWDPDADDIPYTVDPDTNAKTYSNYAYFTGTSMSAPHATGALAILMQRYDYLSNEEVRDVLMTTAAHHDAVEGTSDATSGANAGLGLAADDAPNTVWGWGEIDLKAAMNGPGQFLGAFTADLKAGERDVWTNRITEDALIQRKAEDAAEQAAWQQTLKDKGWDVSPPGPGASVADQVAYEVGMARAGAAGARVYQGSLVKQGDGLLALDGADSTFTGGTELDGGTLEIGAAFAAGLGDITFGAGQQSLWIDSLAAFGGGATFTNELDDFGYGDTIDLRWLDPSASAALSGGALTVTSGGLSYRFDVEGAPADAIVTLSRDGSGGSLLTLGRPQAAGGGGSGGSPGVSPPPAGNPSSPPTNNSTQPPALPSAAIDPTVSVHDGTLTLTGTASAAGGLARLEIFDGTTDLGPATLNADGTWSFDIDLGQGSKTNVRAVAIDRQGQQGAAPTALKLTTGITGEPYATEVDSIDTKTGALLGSSYIKPNGVLYLASTAQPNASGGQTFTYAAGSFFKTKPYSSFADSYDGAGTLLSHVETNKDGSHTINGVADGQRLVSIGNDTFADNGAAERFVFKRGAGTETIADFQVAGAGQDHIVLPSYDAGKLAHILANVTETAQGDTTLHLGHGLTLTLLGVTQQQLLHHKSDFSVHA